MKTIRQVLNKIRWDPRLKIEDYTVGYYDRVQDSIIKLRVSDINFQESDGFSFCKKDDVRSSRIPFHRIRRVWEGENLVWCRNPGAISPQETEGIENYI